MYQFWICITFINPSNLWFKMKKLNLRCDNSLILNQCKIKKWRNSCWTPKEEIRYANVKTNIKSPTIHNEWTKVLHQHHHKANEKREEIRDGFSRWQRWYVTGEKRHFLELRHYLSSLVRFCVILVQLHKRKVCVLLCCCSAKNLSSYLLAIKKLERLMVDEVTWLILRTNT